MTIAQYQDSELSAQLKELLNTPALAIALQICDASSPANRGSEVWAQPHQAHIQLGMDRGYNLYPRVLRACAASAKKEEKPIEATYEAVKEEEEK